MFPKKIRSWNPVLFFPFINIPQNRQSFLWKTWLKPSIYNNTEVCPDHWAPSQETVSFLHQYIPHQSPISFLCWLLQTSSVLFQLFPLSLLPYHSRSPLPATLTQQISFSNISLKTLRPPEMSSLQFLPCLWNCICVFPSTPLPFLLIQRKECHPSTCVYLQIRPSPASWECHFSLLNTYPLLCWSFKAHVCSKLDFKKPIQQIFSTYWRALY